MTEPPPPHGPCGDVVGGFAVTCTDRGQHDRVRITTVRVAADGCRSMPLGGEGRTSWGIYDNGTYGFNCPLCPRTPQIRRDLWWTIVEQTLAAGMVTLDLSRLPL